MIACAKLSGVSLVGLGLLFAPSKSMAQLAPTDPLPS